MRCNLTEAEQKAALEVPFLCTGEEQEFIERCFIGYLFFEHEADENGRLGVTTECTRCGRKVWWTEREWKRFKQENNVKARSDLLCPDCGCGVTLYPRGRLRSGNTLDEYRQVVLLRAIDGALRAVALEVRKHHGRWESDDAEGCTKAAYHDKKEIELGGRAAKAVTAASMPLEERQSVLEELMREFSENDGDA